MILKLLSKLFNYGRTMHTSGEGSNDAQAKEVEKVIIKPKNKMKKAKPNLPASSMLKAPVAAGKVVKKAVKMKKAAKKK